MENSPSREQLYNSHAQFSVSFLQSLIKKNTLQRTLFHDCEIASTFNEMDHSYIEVQFPLGHDFPFSSYSKFPVIIQQ